MVMVDVVVVVVVVVVVGGVASSEKSSWSMLAINCLNYVVAVWCGCGMVWLWHGVVEWLWRDVVVAWCGCGGVWLTLKTE